MGDRRLWLCHVCDEVNNHERTQCSNCFRQREHPPPPSPPLLPREPPQPPHWPAQLSVALRSTWSSICPAGNIRQEASGENLSPTQSQKMQAQRCGRRGNNDQMPLATQHSEVRGPTCTEDF